MATTFTDGTDNPAIFPANALKRSPYASPETPAGQAIGRAANAFGQGVANLPSQIAPATTGALRTAGQNISQNLQNGQYGAAAANTIRGAAEASSGLVQDTIGRPVAGVVNSLRSGGGLGAQGVGFTNALLGTNISPPGETLYTPPVFQDTAGMQAALDASKPAAPAAAPATPAVTPPGVGTPGVTSADRVAQMGRDATNLRALSERSLQNSALGIGVPGTPGMGVMDAGVADARQNFFDQAALRTAAAQSSWSPRGGFKANDAAIQAAAVPIQNRQRLQELSLKNAGDQSIARMRDATDRRGQDISAETAAGAQAVTLRGQELTSATARAQGAREQMNKDRQFALDVQKYGTEVAEKNRVARADAEKSFTTDAETMFRTKDDKGNDVADTAKVGQWKTAVNTTLGEIAKAHRASGDPARIKLADQIEERGYSAMTPSEKAELKQLFDTRERLRSAKGKGPNQGSFVDSDNLLGFRQAGGDAGVDRRIFGGDRVNFGNGSSASIRDLQYKDGPANAILPDVWRTRSPDLVNNLRGFN